VDAEKFEVTDAGAQTRWQRGQVSEVLVVKLRMGPGDGLLQAAGGVALPGR
jgi:hypothetical protein